MSMDQQTPYGQTFRHFLRDERAATAVEYAIIAGGIAAVIMAAVSSVGGKVLGLFQNVETAFPG
jgi:pilus assembly protein Flp/PilA